MAIEEIEIEVKRQQALRKIRGYNDSDYEIESFLTHLERIRAGYKDLDCSKYVVDEFMYDNELYFNDYNETCLHFLDNKVRKERYIRESQGPYEEDFRSWDDYYDWKEL